MLAARTRPTFRRATPLTLGLALCYAAWLPLLQFHPQAAAQPPAEPAPAEPAPADPAPADPAPAPEETLELDASAQARLDSLDAQLKIELPAQAPGLALLVVQDDQVRFTGYYGSAELAYQSPVTKDTKFRIGSITKSMTAAGILKLVSDDKLKLDDRLQKYLPDFPHGDKVTIRQLLNHTSGIHSYTDDPEFLRNVALPIQPDVLIQQIAEAPYDFDPGSAWRYNNSGYFILGHLIEKLSGQSYATFLHDNLFDPLLMRSTGVHSREAILRYEASGYSWNGNAYEKAIPWDMSNAGGAGAIYATAEDLHRWAVGFFSGKVLDPELVQQAVQPTVLKDPEGNVNDTHYGFGWFVDEHRGLPRYAHSGGLQGFSSHLAYYPEQRCTIVALQNTLPGRPELAPTLLCTRLAEIFLEQEMTPPEKHTVDPSVTAEMLEPYVGRYDYGTAVMTISLSNGQLLAQLSGQPQLPIYPASPSLFFWKITDATIEFKRDAKGKVTGVRHRQGSSDFFAGRIPERTPIQLPQEVLQRHVGDYRLTPLGILHIRLKDEQLTANLNNQPPFPIFATAENEFFYQVVEATLTFSNLQNNQSQQVELKQSGQTFAGQRQ